MSFEPLPPDFFVDHPLAVARRLLGQRLAHLVEGELLAGRIVEAEAYGGSDDSTSHAFRGSRGRAMGMYGPPGHAYVYLIYGMYICLNVVAHAEGAGAVLLRALAPVKGLDQMRALRGGVADHLIASGPGRLCQALRIDRSCDGMNLCDPTSSLLLAAGPSVPDAAVIYSPRVGVRGRPEDVARAWRVFVAGDLHVSPGRRMRSGAA